MNYTVITAPSALSDIDERLEFISRTFPEYADILSTNLFQAINKLAFAPKRYKPGYISGTRESLAVTNYLIVFRINEAAKQVEVLHVYHQRQEREG